MENNTSIIQVKEYNYQDTTITNEEGKSMTNMMQTVDIKHKFKMKNNSNRNRIPLEKCKYY